jgi:hypothetical protein
MKKRIAIVVVLTMLLVMLIGVASVAATPQRKITGNWQWDNPEVGFHAWGTINVHETSPGEAEGRISLKEIKAGEEGMVQ